MYAIGNVVKFLEDNAGSINPQHRKAILGRAREQAKSHGVLMAGMARDLWRDDALLEEFGKALSTDPKHREISVTTIRQAHQR